MTTPNPRYYSDVVLDVFASGDTSGVTDANTINNALTNAPTGAIVRLAGTHLVNRPLVAPNNPISVQGFAIGPMQGGAGTPGVGAVVKPTATFTQGTAPALAVFAGFNSAPRQDISDLYVDLSLANAASGAFGASTITDLEGIDMSNGTAGGQSLHRVSVDWAPSWGVYAQGGLGWYAETLIIQNCGGSVASQHLLGGAAGGYFCNITDALHFNVHTQFITSSGIYIRGGDHRLVGCRGDVSTAHGFDITSSNSATGSLGYGVILEGCGSQSNSKDGYFFHGNGTNSQNPFQAVGCNSTNDGSGVGGGFGAFLLQGRVQVSLTDTVISGNGTYPAYGFVTGSNGSAVPEIITADGGFWQVGTAFYNDAAPAGTRKIGPRLYGTVGSININSGTTSWTQVT